MHIVIPARMASERLPGKPLLDIAGMPMVVRVARTCIAVTSSAVVTVSTPDAEIEEACREFDIQVHRSSLQCQSGTDRVAEFSKSRPDIERIVNVQGDEPMLTARVLSDFLAKAGRIQGVAVGVAPLTDPDQVGSNSTVKVATSRNRFVYASRAALPVQSDETHVNFWKHTGLYSFTRDSLSFFSETPKGALELAENVEILRLIENGFPVLALEIESYGRAVDTERDLTYVRQQL